VRRPTWQLHAGYLVDIAGNGKEALDCIHRINYDLILMDLFMPVMDGPVRKAWRKGLCCRIQVQGRCTGT
jgi:DNA-binding response OmpR family regulator